MGKYLTKLCSVILTLVMVFNILPHQVLANSLTTEEMDFSAASDTADLKVVEEVTENRTEFSKEFKMSNGLHMATVYGTAIHYEKNGSWEEIDNTLIATVSGEDSVYTNTAGVWDIAFPDQLSSDNQISVTKDGYTLRFGMAGQLKNNGAVIMGTDSVTTSATARLSDATLEVEDAQISTAQVQQIDTAAMRAEAEYPETVATKLYSSLQYANVYSNTNVVYDLQSNMLKESVVINSYDSDLCGYKYSLDVGTLIPVLNDDNSIWFYDSNQETVVMIMPAPFMLDANNNHCDDVQVVLQGADGLYTLIYLLPQEWLASSERAWPVVLDPVILANLSISNILDITVAENYLDHATAGAISCGYGAVWGIHRFYVQYKNLPTLLSSDIIVSASLQLTKLEDGNNSYTVPIEVHKVTETWNTEDLTWSTKPDFDETVEDFACVTGDGEYVWDVTDIVREWYEHENTGMMFKAPDSVENGNVSRFKDFCSADYGYDPSKPILFISFRNNNGLEGYWDYTTSTAGRAGTGYVNNYTGNLVWVHDDIGFGGNRMPVSISHVYNANDSQNNSFGMGYGWRTNFNQRVYQWSGNSNYYVWEDGDGTKHYFLYDSSEGAYLDEDGLELRLTTSGSGSTKYCITDKKGNKSYFDASGRLKQQQNNQATASSIFVAYTGTSGYLISQIADGAGRVYEFTYSNNLLNRIKYKGTGSSELSYVTFGYSGSLLTSITNKDGKKAQYAYSGNNLIRVTDIDGYKLEYTYNTPVGTWQPYRVMSIKESDNGTLGGELSIQYHHNQTTFTDHNENKQIVQFNNWGNTVSVQDGEGRAQYAKYATDSDAANGKGNQLIVASKLQNTVGNMLSDNSFELGTAWTASGATVSNASGTAYYGNKALKVVTTAAGGAKTTFTAAAGKTYTFSAYVKTGGSKAYLTLGGVSSEQLAANKGWTRLQVSYTNSSSSAQTVTAQLMNAAAGTTYMDCVQVEMAPTASRYNLIVNGDFRFANAWSSSGGRSAETAAAPQLSTNVYKLNGTYTSQNRISQTVNVSGSKDDTFVLAGWVKGNAIPLTQFAGNTYDSSSREFAIIAVFNHTDGSKSDEIPVRFNPDVDNWQYAAAPIVAPKAYSSITVYLAYDYNANSVVFDGIQLYKEQFGNSYTYDEDGNVKSVVDLQKQRTTYEYDSNNNLTKILQDNVAKMTYTYDSYHNVKTATSSEGLVYSFVYDTYGNNTKVSITSGGVTMSSSASYSGGNRLATTTDTAGKKTTYSYNADTNVLEWVKYPCDTDDTKTIYTYDDMYRLASAVSNVKVGTVSTETLSANYAYENDLLKSITTGSTQYSFNYEDFALRSNIQIDTRVLASYIYKDINDTAARFSNEKFDDAPILSLVGLDYGNGDKVQYIYDKQGRVTTQEYLNDNNSITSTISYAYDNNGNLAKTTNSATSGWDIYYYDFTDRLAKTSSKHNGSAYSVEYGYDSNNNLATLREGFPGYTRETSYTYDKDNRITKMYVYGDSTFYAYDSYGRLSTRTTTGHSPTLKETYTYRTVNSNQTGLVSTLAVTATNYSTSFGYAYDSNGNILTVSNGGKTTKYTYDSANQLVREDNQQANKTWYWTYDNAGNITSRKEYAYTTGTLGAVQSTINYTYDGTWGDLLTGYNGKTITSDPIGNMLSDGTWTYTWENGRQLASMASGSTTWNFKYNTDGMRIERKSGSTTYKYFYTGDKLVQMTTPTSILRFTYDSGGKPLTIVVDGTPYYYVTNLQGDVVAILNKSGAVVAEYTYDAWGKLLTTTGSMASTLGAQNPLRYRGYVYDTELGLYYLQSRYYNPEMGRFINADVYTSTGQGLLGNNMFAYCGNNPVVRLDADGQAFESIWDIVSFTVSIADVVANPTDIWTWISLGGDFIDILIPFVGGIGEASKAIKITLNFADGFGDLSRAQEFGIKTYKALIKQLKGTGLQAHHIIEQRLVRHLGIDLNSILSVALTPAEHQKFTNAWRQVFKYGMDYRTLSIDDIWKAAQEIYKDYPDLLDAAHKILFD